MTGTRIRITEHTTTDDPFCEVEDLDHLTVGEFYGSADEFIAEVANPKGMVVVETVWS